MAAKTSNKPAFRERVWVFIGLWMCLTLISPPNVDLEKHLSERTSSP